MKLTARHTVRASYIGYLTQAITINFAPLLFVTFVENAFKHGISYKKKSSVRISFSLDDGKLLFRCFNTLHSHVEGPEGGIGLENAKRRLDLMYGDKYQLDIVEAGDNFTVELIIPGL